MHIKLKFKFLGENILIMLSVKTTQHWLPWRCCIRFCGL